jgi:HlyD family secretion protein
MANETAVAKSNLKWIAAALAVLALIGFLGFRFWTARQNALPDGIASGNGRLEAKIVDVATKEPLRVLKINVDEGAIVKPGDVLVQMDTSTLEGEKLEAEAKVAAATERLALAEASIAKSSSERRLATTEMQRTSGMLNDQAASQREVDVRRAKVGTTQAAVDEANASLATAQREVEAAKAAVTTIQTRIDDATLKSPITGRVLYRLAEEGEVLEPGGKALTLINLEDVYMEIFLPSEEAARTTVGADARITLDFDTSRAIPAKVSFVSPEAQFTPKQVETKSEREKLMFRVKLQVPQELAQQYLERIKTGVRGEGFVQLDPSAEWPARLQNLVAAQPPARPSE